VFFAICENAMAAAKAITEPKIQEPMTIQAFPCAQEIIVLFLKNIPVPITVPTTTDVARINPFKL
jgi:hypothetical protein